MRRAYAYTVVVVVSWSVSMPTNKALLLAQRGGSNLTPLQVAFWGIALGWAALLAVLVVRRRLWRLGEVAGRGWAIVVAMGLIGWAGYAVALNIAFVRLPLPDAVVINYLQPVFVVVFQGAAFGSVVRRLSRWEQVADRRAHPPVGWITLGLLACLAGVATVATEGRPLSLGRTGWGPGVMAALFAAFSWGVYSNLGRFVALKGDADGRAMADVHTWLAMTFGLVMLGSALAASGGLLPPTGYTTQVYLGGRGPLSVGAWPLVAVLGAVYFGGYTLWLAALELGRSAGAAHKLPALTYLVPVVSIALGWVVLREPFGSGFWQGAALIAAGNLVIVLGRGLEARA